MTSKQFIALMERSWQTRGQVRELTLLMEECGELVQACSKYLRGKPAARQQLVEEMGDVILLISKCAHGLGIKPGDVIASIESKCRRLQSRLDKGEWE